MDSLTAGRGVRLPSYVAFCVLTLAAVASQAARAPVLVAPATLAPDAILQVTPLTTEQAMLNHMQHSLDASNTVIYDQQFGNSIGAGLLLGPLGVAANIANTKRRDRLAQVQYADPGRRASTS